MDDSQVTLLADGTADHWFGVFVACGHRSLVIVQGFAGRRFTQQTAAERQLLAPMAIGQVTVVADPHEALGQYVQQEAADEFARRKCHRPGAAAVGVVLILERDAPRLVLEQPTIGDGDAVRVAGQVLQHAQRLVERRLGENYPLADRGSGEPAPKGAWLGQGRQPAVELECSRS